MSLTLYVHGTEPRHAGHVVPFTSPGSHWSQHEYVACAKLGIGFTAHRHGPICSVFHYHFPGVGCTSVVIHPTTPEGTKIQHIYHSFEPTSDWINQCGLHLHLAGVRP